MKKFFVLAAVLIAVFGVILAGCDDGSGNGGAVKLTIKNESSYELTFVLWNNVAFTGSQSDNSIKPGTSVTMEVQAGNGYIRFRPKLNPYSFRTERLVTVEKDKHEEFVFIGNTVVVSEGGSFSSGTLASFASASYSGKVGDEGPGGGIIYFAQGGQFSECSGELGTYNWSDAQTRCKNYSGGGFNDWRLPDRGELDLMYENLHAKGLGGFSSAWYWSATANGADNAWNKNFNSGGWSGNNIADRKYNAYRVRATRSFSIY